MNKFLSLSKTRSDKAISAFYGKKILAILINIIFVFGLFPYSLKSTSAQTILGCDVTVPSLGIANNAVASYAGETNGKINRIVSNTITAGVNTTSEAEQPLRLVNQGIEDVQGNSVVGLGAIAASLVEQFKKQGLNDENANLASLTTISTWAALPPRTSSQEVVTIVKRVLLERISDQGTQELIIKMPNTDLLTSLSGLQASSLKALGLTDAEIEIASQGKILSENNPSFITQIVAVTKSIAQKISRQEAKTKLINTQKQYEQDLTNLRQNKQTLITSGSTVRFKFRLDNQSQKVVKVALPNTQAITAKGLTGSGQVTGVVYRLANSDGQVQSKDISTTGETVAIPVGKSLELDVAVKVGKVAAKLATITLNLQPSCGNSASQSLNILPPLTIENDL
ncbi:MAG: hypothetical protein ACRC80_01990, partial [Waterburya sp.]